MRRALFLVAVLAVVPRTASAEGFALNRFDPAPAADPFFGVQSASVSRDPNPSAVLIGDYAHAPLVLRRRDGGDEVSKIVSDQLTLHANASVALAGRVLFHIDIPATVVNEGGTNAASLTSPSGAAFGDIRLGARLRIFGERNDPVSVALATSLWLPTGKSDAYSGEGRARALPSIIAGGRISDFLWTTTIGFALRPERRVLETPSRSELTFGAGVAVLAADELLQIGPEIYGTTAVGDDHKPFDRSTTTGELLLGMKLGPGPWVVGIAAGPGLGVGLGTPDVRGVATFGYAPFHEEKKAEPPPPLPPKPAPPPDKDDDGIADDKDACPEVKGVASLDPKKHGCPPDKDDDGITDDKDACPEVKGVSDPDPKKNGCPPDKDDDGIADAEDACPDVAGVANVDPKKNGCPPDKDGDGIVDKDDACPDEPGLPDPDPKKNGCPKVILTAKAIVITEQIHFEFNKATIMADSDQLLTAIAKVLTDHPEIKKISVEGHTDNKGAAAFNQTLSQKRADAVVKWLADHGVDKSRMTSKGFGMTKPIADNKSDEGREKNRRVEFRIVDPAPPKEKP